MEEHGRPGLHGRVQRVDLDQTVRFDQGAEAGGPAAPDDLGAESMLGRDDPRRGKFGAPRAALKPERRGDRATGATPVRPAFQGCHDGASQDQPGHERGDRVAWQPEIGRGSDATHHRGLAGLQRNPQGLDLTARPSQCSRRVIPFANGRAALS